MRQTNKKLNEFIEDLIIGQNKDSLDKVTKKDKQNLLSLMYDAEPSHAKLDFLIYNDKEDSLETFSNYIHDIIHNIGYNQDDLHKFMFHCLESYYANELDELYDKIYEDIKLSRTFDVVSKRIVDNHNRIMSQLFPAPF